MADPSFRSDDQLSDVDRLPVDPDVDGGSTRRGVARPVHLRPSYLLLVAAGGAAGTAAREGVTLLIPPLDDFPLATFVINVIGAFALGALLEGLARLGADEGRRRGLRLLLGTGVLGGFTTYSSLATGGAQLVSAGQAAVGVTYLLVTVAVGGLATWAGIAVAAHRRSVGGGR